LTIPAVAVAAYALDKQLVLGLDAQAMVLLLLTFVLSMLTFGTGRTKHPVRAGSHGGVCRICFPGVSCPDSGWRKY